jgi:hypothetical protein
MDWLKPLMGALRQLAKDPNTRDVKYAERQIWVCISQLDEAQEAIVSKTALRRSQPRGSYGATRRREIVLEGRVAVRSRSQGTQDLAPSPRPLVALPCESATRARGRGAIMGAQMDTSLWPIVLTATFGAAAWSRSG